MTKCFGFEVDESKILALLRRLVKEKMVNEHHTPEGFMTNYQSGDILAKMQRKLKTNKPRSVWQCDCG